MKVLSIGSDRNLFDEKSEVRQRIIEYGGLVEELHIVVFNKYDANNANVMPMMRIANNIWLYPTNSGSKWFYIRDALKIGKKILVANGQWLITSQDPFECGLVGWRLAKFFGARLQLQIHTDFLSSYFKKESFLNSVRVIIAKFLIKRADCIRVVSRRIHNSILSKLNFDSSTIEVQLPKIEILPIWVDIEKIKNAPVKTDLHSKYPQFDFIILMASRLTKEKNISMAIEAMHGLIRTETDHTDTKQTKLVSESPRSPLQSAKSVLLLIVGDGPERERLLKSINSPRSPLQSAKSAIIMEDWTDDLASYYKTADLFLLTSNYEGYGRTIIEAMAVSCPVIMTDVGVAGDIVRDGYNGLVVPVDDKKALTDALLKMITDFSLRNNLVASGEYMINKIKINKEEYLEQYKKNWTICGF